MEKLAFITAYKLAGYNQKSLALKTGLNVQTIRRIENGIPISVRTANKIIAALIDGYKDTHARFYPSYFNIEWKIEGIYNSEYENYVSIQSQKRNERKKRDKKS